MLFSASMTECGFQLTLQGEAEMVCCAQTLAGYLHGGECLLLSGTLGAGKTTFARALIHALCGEAIEVVSPTFMLVQEYDADAGFPVLHYDLYRLKQPEELWELGLDEALGHALVLVEWPEIAGGYWPDDRVDIHIGHAGSDNAARRLQVTAHGAMVAALQQFIAHWETRPDD